MVAGELRWICVGVVLCRKHSARDEMNSSKTSDPTMQIVGIAPDGETALARIEQSTPDVALDAELPGVSGLETLREICRRWR